MISLIPDMVNAWSEGMVVMSEMQVDVISSLQTKRSREQ